MNRDSWLVVKNKIAFAVLALLVYGWIEIKKSSLFPSLNKGAIDHWVLFSLLVLSFLIMGKGFYSIIKNGGKSPVLNSNSIQEKQTMRWPFKIMFGIVATFFLSILLGCIYMYFRYVV